jgi:hypothetical protein
MITIFLLFTAIEGGYSMGGAFDSYGVQFLDQLNNSVNGVNSTRPFTIQKGPIDLAKTGVPATYQTYYLDILYNLDHMLDFSILLIVLIAFGIGVWIVSSYKKWLEKYLKE